MNYADQYDMDDSDIEEAMPPRNLMQTAREFLARPVTQQELARAWDLSNHLPSEDRRVAACLNRLFFQADEAEPAPLKINPPAAAVQAPARPATPAQATRQRRPTRDVIDLSIDDDTPPIQTRTIEGKRERSREDGGDRPGDDGPSGSAKIRKRASDTPERNRASKEDIHNAVPEWLLQRFNAVVAAPAPKPSAVSTLPVSPVAVQAQTQQGSPGARPPLPIDDLDHVEDQASISLAQVLAIIPDVEVEYAKKLVDKYSNDYTTCVGHVVDILLADKSFPKASATSNVAGKGKSKASEGDDLLTRLKAYLDKDTRVRTERIPTFVYREAALEYLFEEFPNVPLPFIRNVFADNNLYWAPTFIELTRMPTESNPPYRPLKTARKSKGKGAALPQDDVLTAERATYSAKLARDQAEENEKVALELMEQEEIAQGAVFECGCCFDDVAMSKMVQCTEAHLFCIDCAKKNAEHTLGNRGSEITCMDQNGCIAPFSDGVLVTFLKTPQMLLLEKIRSERAVEAAGLAGLSYCPHCSFGCVIDNPDEKLFYCLNEECLKITCRQCEKPDHLPKTCEEYTTDLKIDTIHRVEEAMTEALLKRCPECSTAVLKEAGCNKMSCTKCRILFCYVCAQKIAGYEHFDERSYSLFESSSSKTAGGKCRLWDDEKMREYERVEAARARAIADLREETGDPDAVVPEEDLAKLGLQKPAARAPGAQVGLPVNYQYRYPQPVAQPGAPAAAEAPRIGGHNAILAAVEGDWHAYIAELAPIGERLQQGDPFAGEGPREEAARQYAAYYRGAFNGIARGPMPAPVLVRVPQVPVQGVPGINPVAPVRPQPLPQPAPQPAPRQLPQVAAPPVQPPGARRRVRGGRA